MSAGTHSLALDQLRRIPAKGPCFLATTANITDLLAGAPSTLDGVALVVGYRILVKDQSTGAQNGLYEVKTVGSGANGVWARTKDGDDTVGIFKGMTVYVQSGTVNAGKKFVLTTSGTIVLGSTSLTFAEDTGGGGSSDGTGSLVFHPSGVAAGNVYTSWSSLMTALSAIGHDAVTYIYFDGSDDTPVDIPAGTYDLQNCVLAGIPGQDASVTNVLLAAGVTFQNLSRIENLVIIASNTVNPVFTTPLDNWALTLDGAQIYNNGTKAVIKVADGFFLEIKMINESLLSVLAAYEVLELGTSSASASLLLDGYSNVDPNTIRGPASASLDLQVYDTASGISLTQPNFAGSGLSVTYVGGTPGGGGSPASFLFNPGGTPDDVVEFDDWSDLMTAVGNATHAERTIYVDDSLGGIIIPAGTYDMDGVVLAGRPGIGSVTPVTITLDDGVKFNGLKQIRNLKISAGNNTDPVVLLATGEVVRLDGAILENAGIEGIFEVPTGTQVTFECVDAQFLAGSVVKALGTATVGVNLHGACAIGDATLEGAAGCTLTVSKYDGASTITMPQGNWSGSGGGLADDVQRQWDGENSVINLSDADSPFTLDVTKHMGRTFTNRGASGEVIINLPAAQPGDGWVKFFVETGFNLKIVSATGSIAIGTDYSIGGGFVESAVQGSHLTLQVLTQEELWVAESATGTWTVETA